MKSSKPLASLRTVPAKNAADCGSCAYMKLKLASPDGTRRERRCTRFSLPAIKVCADWREA